nr:synaptobrevin, longin-like domain protein [Tanacetum cinerariifolium]
YALTVKPTAYVSHIRQFWSTARIKTTKEGTKILTPVDGILRIVTKSSLRRNLKLKDEDGISSLPDTELFENLTLVGYNISPNQKFTFQKGQFSHQWKYLIHTIMQCLSPKSTGFNEFSSNIATALVCLAINRTYNFSEMIFDGLVKNVNSKGEGSDTPTEPHHTPFHVAQPPSHTTHSSSTLSPVTTTSIPIVTPSETTPIRQCTRRARIAQSSALSLVADEPASPLRDVSQGEACPTNSGFIADQDRATIAKSSTLPYDSAPRVTSPAADEGSMQQTINELTTLCTSLERKYSELTVKFQAQEVEINRLKERVKLLEDIEGEAAEGSGGDTPIKGRNIDEGEAAAERASDDTEEMATVLTSMDTAIVLESGAAEFTTGSGSIPTAGPPATEVVAKELEEQLEREDQRMSEQIARDAEVARIHVEEELQSMIDGLDRSNETESAKKQKTLEEVTEEAKSPDEVLEEKIKEMMQLVPIEEVYVEAL